MNSIEMMMMIVCLSAFLFTGVLMEQPERTPSLVICLRGADAAGNMEVSVSATNNATKEDFAEITENKISGRIFREEEIGKTCFFSDFAFFYGEGLKYKIGAQK